MALILVLVRALVLVRVESSVVGMVNGAHDCLYEELWHSVHWLRFISEFDFVFEAKCTLKLWL